MEIPKGSFQFGNHNSLEEWGIVVNSYDVLLPPKRERKVTIPGRSGRYDYGARNYEERPLILKCYLERQITKAELREIAYALSEKKKLVLYQEPDKHYAAELYDPSEVTELPLEIMREFELSFICEPFAYGDSREEVITDGVNILDYKGTAEAPCRIIIENPNDYDVSNIVITAIKRG